MLFCSELKFFQLKTSTALLQKHQALRVSKMCSTMGTLAARKTATASRKQLEKSTSSCKNFSLSDQKMLNIHLDAEIRRTCDI